MPAFCRSWTCEVSSANGQSACQMDMCLASGWRIVPSRSRLVSRWPPVMREAVAEALVFGVRRQPVWPATAIAPQIGVRRRSRARPTTMLQPSFGGAHASRRRRCARPCAPMPPGRTGRTWRSALAFTSIARSASRHREWTHSMIPGSSSGALGGSAGLLGFATVAEPGTEVECLIVLA